MSNSRRPSHINIVETTKEGTLRLAQEDEAPNGPNDPRAGPVLPRREMETENTSVMVKDGSKKEIVSIDAVTTTIQELTIPRMIHILSSSTTD